MWFACILAIFLLVSSGIAYRCLAAFITGTVIELPLPLSTIPSRIGNWTGMELSIPTTTREYMERNFTDDFISRRYINNKNQEWADIYIVYCASRPGGMLGHQPRVCYPGNGWIHDSTDISHFLTREGKKIPCLIHKFHKPPPTYDQTIVLNFYVVNGKLATNQRGFSGFLSRRFNITRNPARYVAQIQISSISEKSIRNAATDITDLILDLLPDENGVVEAVEQISPENGDVK
ncbi:MAG: EpsI family protein [Sedimentisphaerales bacterium]|nr:EpsI family protein [Sedimentisphaerales bacterium]